MRKAAAEDAVRRAGVPWTILQPAIDREPTRFTDAVHADLGLTV